MDIEKSDLDKARKEAIGYVRDRRSKDEHHRHRKSKDDRHSRSTSRSHRDPVSPRHQASSVGSPSGRHRKSSTRHRDEEDREAKRRSRRSKSPAVLPGAVRSTGHHKSRTKSSSSHRDSIKSEEKVRQSTISHSSRPGVVSESTRHDPRRSKRDPSSSKSHGDSKSDRRDSKALPASTNNRKSDPFATMDGGEHFAVAASIVVDDEEERIRKRMEEREAEIRLEIEMQQQVEANAATVQDRIQKKEPRQRQGNRSKVCCAIVCLVLIAGSIVGVLFGTGAIRSSLEPTLSSDLDNEKNVQDIPDGNDDTPGNRTSAPSVGGMDASSVPTSAPTFLAYNPPDTEQCESIRQGQEIQGQEEMIENNFALVINGTLSQDADIESVKAALTNSIQKIIMPKLSGCDESDLQRRRLRRGVMKRRRLQDPYAYIVGNVVVVDITSLGVCVENQTCESFQVDIILYTQGGEVNTIGLIGRISDAFNNGESLVVQLDIDQFFDQVELVGVLALDPTPAPSDAPSSEPSSFPTGAPSATASLSPTFAPVSFPTTKSPTGKPSPAPTSGTPSSAPTNVPSSSPSSRPSIQPAPGATPMPTSEPSTSPTNAPTSVPTSGPTNAPTSGPTFGPTDAPSSEPSLHPTSAPTSQPTSGPTSGPTSRPTNAPSSSPTVKTRLQIITDALVSTAGIDENDLHADIVSWMDTVDSWEPASDDPSYWVERYAMAVYFKETQGSNWALIDTGVSDRSGVYVCSWNGVSCNSNNVVTSFVTNDAWAYSSAATIPTEMGKYSVQGIVLLLGETISLILLLFNHRAFVECEIFSKPV